MTFDPQPIVPVHPRAWLTDAAVARLTLGAQGLYWRLLCHCWLQGARTYERQASDGSLPSDPKHLAVLAGLPVEALESIWPQVEPFFELRFGRYVHRTERELVLRAPLDLCVWGE